MAYGRVIRKEPVLDAATIFSGFLEFMQTVE
jgi:hypothetical protein